MSRPSSERVACASTRARPPARASTKARPPARASTEARPPARASTEARPPARAWSLIVALGLGALPTSAAAAPASGAPVDAIEGPTARSLRLTEVRVVGAEQVSEKQIRAALAAEDLEVGGAILWPEDPRVERARLRLLATDYFSRVTLKLRPGAEGGDTAALIVELEERASLTVTDLFLGSSAMTPFHGGLQLVERNFLGRAIHIGGGFIWGTTPHRIAKARRQQGLRLFVEAPRLPETRFGLGGTFYVVSASEPYRVAGARDDPNPDLFRTVDYTRVGGLLGLSFPITSRFQLGVDYRFEMVDALVPEAATYVALTGESEAIDLALHPGRRRLTSTNFSLGWDGRERAAQIGKGGRFALDLHLASPLVGSEYEYMRLVAGAAYTFRLPWRHWITPSVLAGQIAGRAPRFEQFYGGDLSELTPGRELGILYSTRNAFDLLGTGVDTRAFGSLFGRVDVEYVWPILRRSRIRGLTGGHLFLGAGLFTLAGDAAERALWRARGEPAAPLGLNLNLGLRLETAIGTLDLSVGNVLRRLPL